MNKKLLLEKILDKKINSKDIFLGTSKNSLTVKADDYIFKVESMSDAKASMDKLELFNRNKVYGLFPKYESVSLLKKEKLCIWKLEYFPGKDLESVVMSKDNSDKECLPVIIEKVLDLIFSIYEKTKIEPVPKVCNHFLNEINLSIDTSLNVSNLRSVTGNDLVTGATFVPSIIHNDLALSNIIYVDNTVKFIDPRLRIPRLTGKPKFVFGSLAFDLSGLLISIKRRRAELSFQKDDIRRVDKAIELIESKIRLAIRNQIFNQPMVELCFLAWYTIFTSCKCQYCLDFSQPGRKRLYELMVEGVNGFCS